MISEVDDDHSGEIEFAEFLKVIETQKASAAKANDESDTIEAFVALGGNSDKSGEFSTEKLREVVKVCAKLHLFLTLLHTHTWLHVSNPPHRLLTSSSFLLSSTGLWAHH